MGSGTSTRIERAAAAPISADDRRRWHDRAAALYEELRGPATRLVRRAYGSTFGEHEIEDIYSNAWLGTLRALERRQADLADDEVKSYLLTAVANHASKEIRRRKRKPIAPLEAAGAVAEAVETPDEVAAIEEGRRVTRDLLSSLPPRRRAVMLLRYGWGLEPSEVCGMVAGLSPRAYRKEITRGVEELAAKLKLVDEGRWCEERESLLRDYAAGLAKGDQILQAQRHLEHCRHCAEFVGRLSSHLHDLGAGLVLPGALEAADGHSSLLERAGGVVDRVRESTTGVLSRGDGTSDMVSSMGAARGAGTAGAGLTAKLAGLGAAGKAAVACIGGGAAVTACVAAGVLPNPVGAEAADSTKRAAIERVGERLDDIPHDVALPQQPPPDVVRDPEPAPAPEPSEPAHREVASEEPVVLAPSTPPTEEEFGVAAAAAPVASSGSGSSTSSDPGAGGGAVAQEFGP
jgi:RNA polymerase sigma factor (sigma-70 family)